MSNNKSEKLESKHNTKVTKLVDKQERGSIIESYEKNKAFIDKKFEAFKLDENEERGEAIRNMEKYLKNEKLPEDPAITLPEKFKSDQQLNKIIADPNFVSIFKSLKQKGYTISIIPDESLSTNSYVFNIWCDKEPMITTGPIVSKITLPSNRMVDFIDALSRVSKEDLSLISVYIGAIKKQINSKNKELKDIIFSKINENDFWSNTKYSTNRQDLAGLFNQLNPNDIDLINQSVIKFIGLENIENSNQFTVGVSDGLIVIKGKFLKNRSTGGEHNIDVTAFKKSDIMLDISKLEITIDGIKLTDGVDKNGSQLTTRLQKLFGTKNCVIGRSTEPTTGGFKNFFIKIQSNNLYVDDVYTNSKFIEDNAKSITIKGNTITITNFDGSKNTLEVKK